MVSPAATGFLISVVKGHPPNMIANQNMMTTDAMMYMLSIGVGGAMAPPTKAWQAAPAMNPTTSVHSTSRSPLTGWLREAAKPG